MLIIKQDPKKVITNIIDSDIESKLFVAVIQLQRPEYREQWLYFANLDNLNCNWIGLNVREINDWQNAIHGWSEASSSSLLNLLSNAFFEHSYTTKIFRISDNRDIKRLNNMLNNQYSISIPDDLIRYMISHIPDRSAFK